jgi:predicted esterase
MSARQAAFVGYSNGANMVLATLLRHPETVQAAALMHPMMPIEPPELDLAGKRFLVTYGLRDAIVPEGEAERVAAALKAGGAEVEMFAHPGGHEVTQDEVDALHGFLNSL